jgi:hypothetical protein
LLATESAGWHGCSSYRTRMPVDHVCTQCGHVAQP